MGIKVHQYEKPYRGRTRAKTLKPDQTNKNVLFCFFYSSVIDFAWKRLLWEMMHCSGNYWEWYLSKSTLHTSCLFIWIEVTWFIVLNTKLLLPLHFLLFFFFFKSLSFWVFPKRAVNFWNNVLGFKYGIWVALWFATD